MNNRIKYTIKHPTDFNGLLSLYESLEWNSLNLT
ncbi:GNAT family N-acetyltransferase, partial [Bacillus toyonensis]|nr:GNAT family N-acetyltransferase [Bacillus toyonensis]